MVFDRLPNQRVTVRRIIVSPTHEGERETLGPDPVLYWMVSIAFVWRRRPGAFASHRRKVSLLTAILVAQPLDLGQDEIPHRRMFDSEWDFDEEHVGSSTEFSFQRIAPHRRVELVSGFVQR